MINFVYEYGNHDYDDRALRRRIERLEKALGIGPPEEPKPASNTERVTAAMKAYYTRELLASVKR